MKNILFAFALLIAFGSFAQNKSITLKVPQSGGMAGIPTLAAGQTLFYNGTAWIGVPQYSATRGTGGVTTGLVNTSYSTAATAYTVPALTGIVNVYLFNSNTVSYVILPAPGITNGRTIVLKPVFTSGANGSSNFRIISTVDGTVYTGTGTSYYSPNNGGTEFNITLVCDGTSWWVTGTR